MCLAALAISATHAQPPPDAYQVGITGNLCIANSFVSFTSTSTGNICVSTYAFDTQHPAGLPFSCCSVLAAPSQTYFLAANSDIIPNTLNIDAGPSSLVIRFVASKPLQSSKGESCDAASPDATLASGLQAWIGSAPGNGGTPFQSAQLTDLQALTSGCVFLQENSAGFGICRSHPLTANLTDQDGLFLLLSFFF